MAIKFKISKSAYEKLSDDLKDAYKADGDNYVIDATGMPEPEGAPELKRALERVRAELDDLKDDLKTVTTERDDMKKAQTDGDKDVTKLTKRYEQKMADLKTEFEGKLSAKDKVILDDAIDRSAKDIAGKISTSPAVLIPHVKARLTAEIGEDNRPVVKVLKDGKASDLTTDKLGEEFVANKDFAAIIRASNASGGRTTATPPNKPAVPGSPDGGKPTDLMSMSIEDRVAHIKGVKEANAAT